MNNKSIPGKITPYSLFAAIVSCCAAGFLILAFVNQSRETLDWLIMQHTHEYSFADYFYHIFYGSDLTKTYNSYDVDPCFPPFAYLFYNYLYKIAPVAEMESLREVQFYPYYMFIFVIAMSLCIVLLSFGIRIFFEKRSEAVGSAKSLLLTVLMIFSVPVGMSAIERANSALVVLILLIYAMAFKDSENRALRELSLILIAIAANLKLYPAIFGLLYIKEKRWKEAARLVVYGVVLFVVPFFFMEGFKSMKEFLVIMYLMQGRSIERLTTVRGVITSAFMYFGGEGAKWTGHRIGMIAENIYLLITLFCFFISKSRWKSMFLLISPMVVYVSSAYRYTAAYFLVALLFFFAETEGGALKGVGGFEAMSDKKMKNLIYAVLFAGIFAIPVWAYGLEVENVIYCFIYIMLIVVITDTLKNSLCRPERRTTG